MTPSGYLDNCISPGGEVLRQRPDGQVGRQLPPNELTALIELKRLCDDKAFALYTSQVVKEEIAQAPAEHRRALQTIYALYESLPLMPEEWRMPRTLTSQRSGPTSGPIVHDELLGRLLTLLPDQLDARHIYQAAKNGIDYFITRDEKTILRYATEIHAMASVEALLPSEVVAKLGGSGST